MNWVKNSWYAAAWSNELGDKMLAREFFGRPMVIFRKEDGTPAMLADQCPHKRAPLSKGVLDRGIVACPYHGLQFDGTGKCVRIPGQANIPPSARVDSYPCVEHAGLVWFWPGDPALADRSLLFPFMNLDRPGWTSFQGPYTLFPAGIEDILDNLVDPSHTTFVHRNTIGGDDAGEIPLTVEQQDNSITVGRWIENSKPVPVMQRYGNFTGPIDRWQSYYLYLPNISLVDMGGIDAGKPRDEESRNTQYRSLSYAALTPETGSTTHYFWFVLRSFAPGDEQVSKDMCAAYVATFDEDRALLGEIQRNKRCNADAVPLRLAIDNAGIRLNRSLQKLVDAERLETPDTGSSCRA
jgi:phenylpropionate dioxygenase-like ring-hydroxylating dioxygenase large terminal subunit